ncbi:Dual specificity protein kinase FUZ7 [Psilocybe cubensis]|uniref:Protein kinase domain-containing protein n=2 Tax=Psilocybe cubensis TaxID=181762 RepID=A0A8H7XSU4_PSICU|nr:Dual specificity protein kinase FUZ7 [Psilocybe cubensis]KAH9480718.1 Dual specificity protein kinase FUZ7 [Psilocybe cubensis]
MAMATPIRKKRNWKALQLSVAGDPSPATAPEGTEPMAIRQAPAPVVAATASAPVVGGKRRPPPMVIKAPKIPTSTGAVSAVEQDGNMLTVGGNLNQQPHSASPNLRRNTYHATLSNTLANLDMNAEIKFDLKNEDLKDLQELGQGNGGSVKKVEHIPTKTIMAKKIVLIDAKPSVRKQILRELQIMHDCHSKYIISFWGAFLADPNICMCIEFMDKGSLDGIYKKIGPIDIDIVGQVALAVLEGLTYLYDVHRIIHRDIKPSNILLNSRGEIKICDFGVSGELINSIADTFVGTSTYMSPERIQGAQYTVKSDVWSLGISLIELALGRFPFSESTSDGESDSDYEGTLSPARPGSISLSGLPPARIKRNTPKKDKRKSKGVSLQGGGMTMSILELLQHIVNEPAPRLTPEGRYPKEAEAFIDSCLLKDPDSRKTPKDLLKDAWIEQARVSTVNLEDWASTF